MLAKSIFLLCAHALLIKVISAACWGNAFNSARPAGCAGEGLGWTGPCLAIEPPFIEISLCDGTALYRDAGWIGYGPAAVAASNGGGLAVSSASPIPPVGVSVASDNAIEGILAVGGEVPFLGTVGLEGALPTVGAGAVSYGCGNGAVGMVTEDVAPTAAGLSLPTAGLGYGYGPAWTGGLGWASRGMGFNGCGRGAL